MVKVLFLILSINAYALPYDCVREQATNVKAIQTATATYFYGAGMGCPQAGTPRMATIGNSWLAGYIPVTAVDSDGWRYALLYSMWNIGKFYRWVGTRTASYQTQMGCPVTDAISGADVPTIYAQISVLPTVIPTPTSDDIVWLGPALANPPGAKTLAQCIIDGKALITRTAAVCAPCKIYVTTDLLRPDDDMTTRVNGMQQAFTWAAGNGYNVSFFSITGAVTVNSADYGADNVHMSAQGNAKVAASLFTQMPK